MGSERHSMAHLFRCFRDDHHLRADRQMSGRKGKGQVDTIEVTKVVEANQKLYINRQEGFVSTGLKKDEFICNCSDLDDIIIFYKDGIVTYHTQGNDKSHMGGGLEVAHIDGKNLILDQAVSVCHRHVLDP